MSRYQIFAPGTADPNLAGGSRQQSLDSAQAHSFLWTGHIVHVDIETMVCSIALDLGAAKEYHDVPLPSPGGSGPRSWAGCVPEPGSKVLVQWNRSGNRGHKPFIVGFMTAGVFPARQYEPFSAVDPKDAAEALAMEPDLADDPRYNLGVIRLKLRKAYGGDFLASSSSGSDFLLDKDATLQNRAGNEFKLRDSDQTSVLQVLNEFVSSSAGLYRRGLIRRNAFNFLPDLLLSAQNRAPLMIGDKYVDDVMADKTVTITNSTGTWSTVLVDQIDKTSPAFDILNAYSLIDDSGKVKVPDQTEPIYPFIVTPDGRRQSYVVHGTHDMRWDQWDECYVEDRAEIYHTHDGVMSVTEEGDGIEVDHSLKRVFIEDVRGTVVGNDPYTDAGQALYKRILGMQMFKSLDDMDNPHPELYPIDTVQSPSLSDSVALARYFSITCPSGSAKKYVFGITKEGRVFLNVPSDSFEQQSVDMRTEGGVKAFLGANGDRVSLNLKTLGGVKLDLGTFIDESSTDQDSVSVDVTYHGKVKTTYAGIQGRETVIGGTDYISVGGSYVVNAGSGIVHACGGTAALEAEGRRANIGTGGYALRSLGSYDITCLEKASESFALMRLITNYLGSIKTVVSGVDTTLMLSGVHSTAVAAGAYAVTVGAGNLSLTSGVNATLVSVANLALGGGVVSSIAGGAHTTVAGGVNMMSGAVAMVFAPVVKIGTTVVGNVVAGIPGPPIPAMDYVTGLPLQGIPTALIGP